jgi:hypothetical protein
MADYKHVVQAAQSHLLNSALKDLLLPLWRLLEFQGHNDDIGSPAVLDAKGNAVINLYPSLHSVKNAEEDVLRQFGLFILKRSGERGEAIWKNKLDVPTVEQVATVKGKLEDAELRKTCKTYKDVLDSYPNTGGSVDRLVYINVVNALLANNIAYMDSVGVDIMEWGPTTSYCKREKYHCLVPLTSAYAPADVHTDFGSALTSMVLDQLNSVRDKSVAYSMRGIVQRVVRIAMPDA